METSPETNALLTFEMMYCLLNACAYALSRKSPHKLLLRILTAGLISGGQARVPMRR